MRMKDLPFDLSVCDLNSGVLTYWESGRVSGEAKAPDIVYNLLRLSK